MNRRQWVALVIGLLVVGGGVLAMYLDPGPAGRAERITSQVELPEQIVTRGGSGPTAWWLVAMEIERNHRQTPVCTELRDSGGTRSASICGYQPNGDQHGHIDYNEADLPDGRYIWFGPTPDNAVTALLRFRDGQVAQVATVAVSGMPGRFFYYVGEPPATRYPIVIVFDADGRQIDV